MIFSYKLLIAGLFSFSLGINSLLFVPQMLKLFKTKNPNSLSFLTFLGFNCVQFLGVLHCYLIKDYFPMIGWLASLITCGTITLLILFYKYLNKQNTELR